MAFLAVVTSWSNCKIWPYLTHIVYSQTNVIPFRIVVANDVAASTAQLVAASRVKASFMSKSQERLENASKAVTGACRSLVKQVQEIISAKNNDENETVDYSNLSGYEIKVQEMEQQVYHFLSTHLGHRN